MTKPTPTGQTLEDLADKTLARFLSAQSSALFDHKIFRAQVLETLMEFYELKFPGCRACADEGYHLARAEMLTSVIEQLEQDAGRLWIKRREAEAGYLRDVVAAPFRSQRTEELEHATKFGAGFHVCTLTGLHP